MLQQKKLVLVTLIVFVSICDAYYYSLRDDDVENKFCNGKKPNLQYCRNCTHVTYCRTTDLGMVMTCDEKMGYKSFCSDPKDDGNAVCVTKSTCPTTPISPEDIGDPPICTRIGRLPDPLACRVYWECAVKDENKTAENYICPDGTQFNPVTETCQIKSTTNYNCVNFGLSDGICKGKGFQYVIHPKVPSLYAFCMKKFPIITCQSKNYIFNVTSEKCVFKCQEEGIFKDYSVTTGKNFITCVNDSKKGFKWNSQECKNTALFDEDLKMCKAP